jgi:hypothetical protein
MWRVYSLLGMTAKQANIQQPLLSNSSVNKHVSTVKKKAATVEETFSTRSMTRRYFQIQLAVEFTEQDPMPECVSAYQVPGVN